MGTSPTQGDLFGEAPGFTSAEAAVRPALLDEAIARLADRLPKRLRLGTSTWSFPGWAGIVYAESYPQSALAREGLAAYARHPLLRAAGIDRTFYAPIPAAELQRFAAAVPDDFRFVVKAYSGLTTVPESGRGARVGKGYGASRPDRPPVFLDAEFATAQVVEPLVSGLGDKLGIVLFQFSPLGSQYTRAPRQLIDRLGDFLDALPRGPVYAVELRNAEILGADYEAMLQAAGAIHCASVHSRMPPVDVQVNNFSPGPLMIRWMLQPALEYESAGERYAPFDRLVDPDPINRARVAALVSRGLAEGRDVYAIASNNAEGSAPLTLLELARAIDGTTAPP